MIRKATQKDADHILPLIMVILEDMELDFLKKYGKETVMDVLQEGYLNETFRYGYKRALVFEDKNEIVGTAFGYHEEDEAIIDQPLSSIFKELKIPTHEQMFTDKEAFQHEWYLDSIAVRSDQRGKGVGAKLLRALPTFAKEQGSHILGLNVDEVNPRAKKLYTKEGFKDVGKVTIGGHLYDHMQKIID